MPDSYPKRNKIVVVDNAPYILLIIEEKLQEAGFDVITLRESKKAVEIVYKEMPDLVILDWMMPDLSGIDICKILKADKKTSHIPIFMLTGKGNKSDEQLGLSIGVEKYITKPFSPRLLLELVKKSIGKHRA